MKIKFTCIAKMPPVKNEEDWRVDLELIEQQGIKLKELVQISASPEAARIFHLGAEYELSLVQIDAPSLLIE